MGVFLFKTISNICNTFYLPMKYILLALAMLFLYACNALPQKKVATLPPHTRKVELQLKDSLGTLELAIPERYDTMYNWIFETDCRSCGDQKYRFQSKRLPTENECWMNWKERMRKDSVDRFTISHVVDTTSFFYDSSTYIRKFYQDMKDIADIEEEKRLCDTFLHVGDQEFAVFVSKPVQYGDILYNHIYGCTNGHKFYISFDFELRAKTTDTLNKHFIDRTMALIQHIHVKK